jgi:DNA-binding response OmpR family regulator
MTNPTLTPPTPLEGGVSATRRKRKQLVPARSRPLILIVEDDTEMREMLTGALCRRNYEVVAMADGDEALTWLGPGVLHGRPERTPSLIVSDIRLPYFSGLEILEGMQLSRQPVPVILITGFGDAEVHARADELGAALVLDKPFELRELLAGIASVLHHATDAEGGPFDGDGHGS